MNVVIIVAVIFLGILLLNRFENVFIAIIGVIEHLNSVVSCLAMITFGCFILAVLLRLAFELATRLISIL